MDKTDFIGKTVTECIELYPIKVKLGAKSGSGYVYCGSLEGLDCDSLDEMVLQSYRTTLRNAERDLEVCKRRKTNYKDYRHNMISMRARMVKQLYRGTDGKATQEEIDAVYDKYEPTEARYISWRNDITRRREALQASIRRTKAKIEKYKTVRDRVIVDAFESIDPEEGDTWILLFKGTERGMAWTTKEFEMRMSGVYYDEDD